MSKTLAANCKRSRLPKLKSVRHGSNSNLLSGSLNLSVDLRLLKLCLEPTMTELGGGIDELKLDFLKGTPRHLLVQGLAKGDHPLLRSHHTSHMPASRQHVPVVPDLQENNDKNVEETLQCSRHRCVNPLPPAMNTRRLLGTRCQILRLQPVQVPEQLVLRVILVEYQMGQERRRLLQARRKATLHFRGNLLGAEVHILPAGEHLDEAR
jgi:hypothetical protein